MSKVDQLRALREARFSGLSASGRKTLQPLPSPKPSLDPFSLESESKEEAPPLPAPSSGTFPLAVNQPLPQKVSAPPASPQPTASSRPAIEPGKTIQSYSDAELKALMFWLQLSNPGANAEELITLAMMELGFTRRGKKIIARLADAI